MTSNLSTMEQSIHVEQRRALLARIDALRGVRNACLEEVEGGIGATLLAIPEANEDRLRAEVRAVANELGVELGDGSIIFLTNGTGGSRFGRRNISRVNTDRSGGSFIVSVSLELGGDILTGEKKSSDSQLVRLHSVAQAALSACRDLLDEPAEVEDVCLLCDGERRSVLVSVLVGSAPLLGSATVRFDEYDATARAVLDAVNRRVSRGWVFASDDQPMGRTETRVEH